MSDETRTGAETGGAPEAAPAGTSSHDTNGGGHSALVDTGVGSGAPGEQPVITVEALLEDLERVTAERDTYLDEARRIAAEFANYRKQIERRHAETVEQAAAKLAQQLLPVLDACDGALAHGAADVEPIQQALLGTLEKEGLTRLGVAGEAFDPASHEAVMHEAGDEAEPVVAEVLRPGYAWKGRVVRAAMVKVRG